MVLIAIAALYLTFTLHPSKRSKDRDKDKPQPRRSSRRASRQTTKLPISRNPDPVTVLAQADDSLQLIATILQEIITMYTLWYWNNEESGADICV
ncbi:hypothetical protein BKA70DRAFT_281682 [Coprinopsis sp. MPI-PUGE-AT-0042]|nr:hypothetical protein BKA70DRAFT_281682 [Coprinopsis sp. MPI-PUGE-AT-0042]